MNTIPRFKTGEIKTDKRDAKKIAQSLAFGTYRAVYIPTTEDLAVKEYLFTYYDLTDKIERFDQKIEEIARGGIRRK